MSDDCYRCNGAGCNHCVGFPPDATFEERTCPGCDGQGCDVCDGFGTVRVHVTD